MGELSRADLRSLLCQCHELVIGLLNVAGSEDGPEVQGSSGLHPRDRLGRDVSRSVTWYGSLRLRWLRLTKVAVL